MALIVLVTSQDSGEPMVGPSAAERLAMLGVTRVSLLREGSELGVMLEGWAFSPASVEDAIDAMFPAGTSVRTFIEVESVVVTASHRQGSK